MTGNAAILLISAALLAACPRVPPPSSSDHSGVRVVDVPAPSVLYVQSPLVGVLDGVGMMLMLPRERQKQEIDRLAEALTRADLPTDRLQLALLLTLGDEGVRDTERARALLRDRTWDTAGYETLTRLILQLLQERHDHARSRLDAAIQLEAERRARQELEERLEAIKAIESDIEARELGAETSDGDPTADSIRR